MLNDGVAFGFFPGIRIEFLLVLWIIMVFFAVKSREKWEKIGLVMIIIGGAKNLMSRYLYGGVWDYMSFGGVIYNNLADYLIVVGALFYGYSYIVRR